MIVNLKKVSLHVASDEASLEFGRGSTVIKPSLKAVWAVCGRLPQPWFLGFETESIFSHHITSIYGNPIFFHPLCPRINTKKDAWGIAAQVFLLLYNDSVFVYRWAQKYMCFMSGLGTWFTHRMFLQYVFDFPEVSHHLNAISHIQFIKWV